MAELVVEDIVKEYPTRTERLVVLKGCSFSLSAGQALAILGPSGSGKSTLLHIVGTLDRPTSGSVRLGGVDPFGLAEASLARFRSERIGFVFQDHYLLPQCTVLENVLVPALAAGGVTPAIVERAQTLLARVGLSERLDHLPSEISGGERQRAALARALVMRPMLLLADEPTGNLDRAAAAAVARLLVDLQREESLMLVLVTHSLELASHFPRRAELEGGRLQPLAGAPSLSPP
ncbi:MAG: ABC transporter ATP-binding protein [Pirellulales bacterium]|nr:ABC transporter ATP-binding protein [Pirellulales bacterium]